MSESIRRDRKKKEGMESKRGEGDKHELDGKGGKREKEEKKEKKKRKQRKEDESDTEELGGEGRGRKKEGGDEKEGGGKKNKGGATSKTLHFSGVPYAAKDQAVCA